MIFRKEYLLMMVGLLANSIGFAQSRMEKSFNEGWKFYKANNSTFFTDFENGQKYFEN